MDEFIGNRDIRERLRVLTDAERLHSCMLFEGPGGVGKSTTAIWLAMLANCTQRTAGDDPCGECWSCRQIPKNQHPDIIRVGLDSTKTASIISVGQARKLISQLTVKPFNAKHRFVFIEPADALTPEAANALLKTFEDPPSQTHFVLISAAPVSLLLTVRSRSQRVRFAPVPDAELVEWLSGRAVENPKEVARLAEGRPGYALTLNPEAADDLRTLRDTLVDALAQDAAGRFRYAESLCKGDRSKWIHQVESTLDAASSLLRDALACSHGSKILYNEDRPELVATWANCLGPTGVAELSIAISDARDRLQRFVSGRVVMDALMGRLVEVLKRGEAHAVV